MIADTLKWLVDIETAGILSFSWIFPTSVKEETREKKTSKNALPSKFVLKGSLFHNYCQKNAKKPKEVQACDRPTGVTSSHEKQGLRGTLRNCEEPVSRLKSVESWGVREKSEDFQWGEYRCWRGVERKGGKRKRERYRQFSGSGRKREQPTESGVWKRCSETTKMRTCLSCIKWKALILLSIISRGPAGRRPSPLELRKKAGRETRQTREQNVPPSEKKKCLEKKEREKRKVYFCFIGGGY